MLEEKTIDKSQTTYGEIFELYQMTEETTLRDIKQQNQKSGWR